MRRRQRTHPRHTDGRTPLPGNGPGHGGRPGTGAGGPLAANGPRPGRTGLRRTGQGSGPTAYRALRAVGHRSPDGRYQRPPSSAARSCPEHPDSLHRANGDPRGGDPYRTPSRPRRTPGPSPRGGTGTRHRPLSQSAALLFRRRTRPDRTAPHSVTWTAAGWTAHTLADHPGRRTAAVELSGSRWLLRRAQTPLLTVRVEGSSDEGTVVRTDPAAVLSGVHAWLTDNPYPDNPQPGAPVTLHCEVAGRTYRAHLAPAADDEAAHEL